MMKSIVFLSLVSLASAFTPSVSQKSGSALNLFGGGNKEKKAPGGGGMMDQLAMFKKAQEMAKKKQQLDEELKLITFEGVGADGKVKGKFNYVPVMVSSS